MPSSAVAFTVLALLSGGSAQVALHQLVVVAPGESALIRLAGYDPTTASTQVRRFCVILERGCTVQRESATNILNLPTLPVLSFVRLLSSAPVQRPAAAC